MCLQDPTSRSSSARLPGSGGENKGATGGAIRIVFDLRGAAFWSEIIQIGWVPLQFPTLKWKTNMKLEGTQEIQLPLLPSYPHVCFPFPPVSQGKWFAFANHSGFSACECTGWRTKMKGNSPWGTKVCYTQMLGFHGFDVTQFFKLLNFTFHTKTRANRLLNTFKPVFFFVIPNLDPYLLYL